MKRTEHPCLLFIIEAIKIRISEHYNNFKKKLYPMMIDRKKVYLCAIKKGTLP